MEQLKQRACFPGGQLCRSSVLCSGPPEAAGKVLAGLRSFPELSFSSQLTCWWAEFQNSFLVFKNGVPVFLARTWFLRAGAHSFFLHRPSLHGSFFGQGQQESVSQCPVT